MYVYDEFSQKKVKLYICDVCVWECVMKRDLEFACTCTWVNSHSFVWNVFFIFNFLQPACKQQYKLLLHKCAKQWFLFFNNNAKLNWTKLLHAYLLKSIIIWLLVWWRVQKKIFSLSLLVSICLSLSDSLSLYFFILLYFLIVYISAACNNQPSYIQKKIGWLLV